MTQWDYPYAFPYFTGAEGDEVLVDPAAAVIDPAALVEPVVVDDGSAALLAQQQLAAQQAALLAQQRAQQLAQQAALVEVAPLPVARRHHIWRRHDGSMFRTLIGSWKDHRAHRAALAGRLVRVAGETAVGAAGELYFQVVNPSGATLRWQDGSPQEGHPILPPGTIFQGTLRPHELVEVSLPGYAGWLNVYELNQLGATRTGMELAGAGQPDHMPPPFPQPMPHMPCPTDMVWNAATMQCEPPSPVLAGADGDPWGTLEPTCPTGTHWQPGSLACVPNIPPPPPSPVSTLQPGHVAGWWGEEGRYPYHNEWEWGHQFHHRHPWQSFVGAAEPEHPHEHAQRAQEHAAARDAHAHESQRHPSSEGRDHHAREAGRHAERVNHHEREARGGGRGRGGFDHRGGDHRHPAFGFGRGGRFERRGHGGFSRAYHQHPEWHHVGHPAWRGGVHPRWRGHRASCAGGGILGALLGGPIGALFGARRGCLIEKISHPEGRITYRVTPAGEQEGATLDLSQVDANNQYTQATGQPAPAADAGPMPGSNTAASGATPPDAAALQVEPDHPADVDTLQVEPDHAPDVAAPDAGGADTTAQAAQQYRASYFAGAPTCGPNEYWDPAHQACVPVQLPQPQTTPPVQCPAGTFFDYFKQTCVPMAAHTAGASPCGPSEYWDDAHQACVPVSLPMPSTTPPVACPPNMFFDYFRQTCVPMTTHAAGASPCGPTEFWDDASQSCIPLTLPQPSTVPTAPCPPGTFFDYFKQTCVPQQAPHAAGYAYGFDPYGFNYATGANMVERGRHASVSSWGRGSLPSLGRGGISGWG
jgi:hypothetical protein